MTRVLPSRDQILSALSELRREASTTGKPPTVLALACRLGLANTTFRRSPDIELGFHLARAHWGHGFATEAARACLAWALAERPERVVAIVDPANQGSVPVLDKIGMLRAGAESHFGRRWLLYAASSHDGIAEALGAADQ